MTCKEHAAADVRPPVPGVPGRHYAVSTLLLAAENSRTNYAEIGLTGHHSTSHHGNNPENLKKYSKLNRYNVQMFAEFVKKMPRRPMGTARCSITRCSSAAAA